VKRGQDPAPHDRTFLFVRGELCYGSSVGERNRAMRKVHLAVASLSLAAGLLGAGGARAEGGSNRSGAYVSANPLGFMVFSVPGQTVTLGPFGGVQTVGGGSTGAYHMDFEGGYHFAGTHEGFGVGLRQGLNFATGGVRATTQAKFGYAIPIALSGGKMELNIEPYGALGAAYGGGGGNAAFAFGFGAEFKFFPIENNGFFVGGHPVELGGWIDGGFVYTMGLGAGYAF
jgi:hypothetical protein